MIVAPDVLGLIGNTPLVRLKRASELTGCEILGKAEFMNVGGSIKDRAALSIIRKARAVRRAEARRRHRRGHGGQYRHRPGPWSGRRWGHPVVIVMPRSQTDEKKRAVRLHGARLIEVDPAPFASPNHFVAYSRRLAEELNESEPNGAFYADQFDNLANREAHYDGTAPEIWKQTDGAIDGFICAVGSGGTLAGLRRLSA